MKHVIRTYVHNSNRLPLLACIRTQYVCSRCPCCFGRKLSVIVSLLRKLKHYCLVLSFGISDAMSDFRGAHIPGLGRELGGRDGALTFDEAIMHTTGQGLKLKGPETRPLSSIRDAGDVNVGDLPVRFLDSISGKVEQFCDAIQHVKIDVTADFFESKLVKECMTCNYKGLPEPFRLRHEPQVPYIMQIVILPATPPEGGDPNSKYVHIFKHVYLHRTKIHAGEAVKMCYGISMRFEWGTHTRQALVGLTYMLDKMGGMQIRNWVIQPKFEKRVTVDQSARDAGYRFIKDHGPKTNNANQFMEWTDNQIHTPGSPIENWAEPNVITALQNYMRGRQNAKTLEYWPFTFKSLVPWFFDDILVPMLGSIRQHSITWIGKTRTGKSLGSKVVAFCQSKYEIDAAQREDLIPSIVTGKHLDFFKAEPLTKYKPGIFDDGNLQRMDASFLKAFLNPSEAFL